MPYVVRPCVTVPRRVTCDDPCTAFLAAKDVAPDTTWALIIASRAEVIAHVHSDSTSEVITFDCTTSGKHQANTIQNILKGLGFYETTSDVPPKLFDRSLPLQYTLTKAVVIGNDGVTRETVVKQADAPLSA